jgi:hypothetical protein
MLVFLLKHLVLVVCSQVVRHRLLRCLLDAGDGLRARELLEEMSYGISTSSSTAATAGSSSGKPPKSKKSKTSAASAPAAPAPTATATPSATAPTGALRDARSCCCYNRAFIEHIAIMLEEPDASEELRDQRLGEGKRAFTKIASSFRSIRAAS